MAIGMTIKSRFILTVGTVILFSCVCMGIYSYRNQTGMLLHQFEDLPQNESRLFETILRADAEGLRRTLIGLSRIEAFAPPLEAKDRLALLAAAHPLFDEIKTAHGITHMYFIAPDGTVLLRMHNPAQFGDRLERESYRRAAATGRTFSGLELGKNFFSLRCVTPVSSDGKLLGYLEVAEEIDHVFAQMKAITGNDVALLLSNDYIRQHKTDVRPDGDGPFAVLYPTNRQLILPLVTQLQELEQEGLQGFAVRTVAPQDEKYVVGAGPVWDVNGKAVGALLSFRNVTPQYSAIWQGVMTGLAVFAAILAGGNLLLYVSMKKSMNLLQALRSHIQGVTRTWDLDRRLEVNTSDEIGELAADLNLMQTEIGKLKSSLERQAEELATVNQELESFSYTLSHDLRMPLTRVYTAVQMIAEGYADRFDETGRLLLDNIGKGCEGMEELIEAVLTLAKIVRKELNNEELDLSPIAREIGDALAVAEPDRAVTLVVMEPLACRGDRQLLKIALTNLLENAWKYTRPVAAPKVEVGVIKQKGKQVFFVRDNGVGFDMQHAAKLFVPFKRLHDAGEFPGTGIGLATVQKIIQRHGGTIWGQGKPGEGASFFFTLP